MTLQIVEPRVEQARLAKVLEQSITAYNEICNDCGQYITNRTLCQKCPIEAFRNQDISDAQRLYNEMKVGYASCTAAS